jgi:hypothetical protein
MNLILILMLTGVKASGTATLSFIFPASEEKEAIQLEEKVSQPAMSVDRVYEDGGSLKINLVSSEKIEFAFDVLYDDGSVESYSGDCIDGSGELEVPIVLSGSRRKIRWVNILWEDDGLVVCNASNDNLPDLSCASAGQFEKN